MFVYLIVDKSQTHSYRGFTVNLKRRLRQHRSELAGGARYTKRHVGWHFLCFMSGFETKKEAMSYEWYTKKSRTKSIKVPIMNASHYKRKLINRFCHPVLHQKFAGLKSKLCLYCFDRDEVYLQTLRTFYQIQVKSIQSPFEIN